MAVWHCRVCGLDYDYSPWGPHEDAPDYGTCECCGAQFGVDDYSVPGVKNYRAKWLAAGGKWFYMKLQPANWNPETQLAQVPEQYR